MFVIMAGILFYWYEYRPSNIRKECAINLPGPGLDRLANEYVPGQTFNKDKYESCLHRNGL